MKVVKTESSISTCGLCGTNETETFLTRFNMPSMDGILLPSEERAFRVSVSDIKLAFCNNCGFIFKEGNEERINSDSYNVPFNLAPSFQNHMRLAADRLITRYGLTKKSILDIACGDSYFLGEICKKSNSKGIGMDTKFDPTSLEQSSKGRLKFIRNHYSSNYSHLKVDLLIARLVLDLVHEPIVFLKMIHKNLRESKNAIVYFEVLNTEHTLKASSIWNLDYNPRSWFTKESLRYIFSLCGFEILDIYPCWQDKLLAIEARPSSRLLNLKRIKELQQNIDSDLKNKTIQINESFKKIKLQTRSRLENIRSEGKKIIAWGAGVEAFSFFNLFQVNDLIKVIVEVDEKFQGKYLAGSGQKIVAPEYLKSDPPDLVLITNPAYAEEIKSQVRSWGLESEFWILG